MQNQRAHQPLDGALVSRQFTTAAQVISQPGRQRSGGSGVDVSLDEAQNTGSVTIETT